MGSPRFARKVGLQDALIVSAIDSSFSPDVLRAYLTALHGYDGVFIGERLIAAGLLELAFLCYHRCGDSARAAFVLLEHLHDFRRAVDFAKQCNHAAVTDMVTAAWDAEVQQEQIPPQQEQPPVPRPVEPPPAPPALAEVPQAPIFDAPPAPPAPPLPPQIPPAPRVPAPPLPAAHARRASVPDRDELLKAVRGLRPRQGVSARRVRSPLEDVWASAAAQRRQSVAGEGDGPNDANDDFS